MRKIPEPWTVAKTKPTLMPRAELPGMVTGGCRQMYEVGLDGTTTAEYNITTSEMGHFL